MEELFNRDSNTHMEHNASDLMNPRPSAHWEMEIVEGEIINLGHEPDLEQYENN